MSDAGFYHAEQRALQSAFGSTALADRLSDTLRRTAFNDGDKAFIESVRFFFLATADAQGRPDCSFKGGAPGFVRVLAPDLLVFPDYDGNGMFRSLGNIVANPNVGVLFIELSDAPKRVRVNGSATVSLDDPLLPSFPISRCASHHPRDARAHFPELPALHPRSREERTVGLRAGSRQACAGASLEELRLV